MAKKNGNGEGSIYWCEDRERYAGAISLGIVDGKPKRKVIYGKTRREVADMLTVMRRDQQQGLPVAVERRTVAQFLNRWMTDKIVPNRRPNTIQAYGNIVRLHINPQIGHIQLAKLTPQDVEALIRRVRDKGLSAEMQRAVRKVLRTALNQALKWGFVVRNVASLTDAPAVEQFPAYVLTVDQAETLLDAARGDRLEGLYAVALWLGLRRGEVLGLRWQDIDLDVGRLRVHMAQQITAGGKLELAVPKTQRSRRTLPLPAALVPILRAHHARQLEERLRAGARWQDHGLVFCTGHGTPISPRNLVRSFKALLHRAGLPDMRFHDLRHSCASMLASAGLPARVAMEVLGHANISTTMNVYAKVYDDAKREAADVMDRLFGDKHADKSRAI